MAINWCLHLCTETHDVIVPLFVVTTVTCFGRSTPDNSWLSLPHTSSPGIAPRQRYRSVAAGGARRERPGTTCAHKFRVVRELRDFWLKFFQKHQIWLICPLWHTVSIFAGRQDERPLAGRHFGGGGKQDGRHFSPNMYDTTF